MGQEDSPGGGNGNPLQYSCLDNSRGRGAWWSAVHGAAKCWTQLCVRACTHTRTHSLFTTYHQIKDGDLLLGQAEDLENKGNQSIFITQGDSCQIYKHK